MEIKPVGRERDIQIAKLKGYEVGFFPSEEYEKDFFHWYADEEGNRTEILFYSTNRNDVWELFGELHSSKRQIVIDKWKEVNYDMNQFAPIVSDVWIIWKESK